jgi:1-acyl-sn-glycerol-3-phosphate acyltransferase
VRIARLCRRGGEFIYAAWWWAVIGTSFALGWFAVMLLPRVSWRWAVLRGIARVAFRLVGAPFSVTGLENIPSGGAVLAFNHSGYMDALAVAAALPGTPTYVVKKELAGQMFAGPLLRRLGALFLDRFEVTDSLTDLAGAQAAAQSNRHLVFFPEGTFTRRAGLSGFYLGTFKVAAQANLPVVPGILRGTRQMLRGEQWFPRWSPVSVTLTPAIMPSGTDLAAIVRLRDDVRDVILSGCGEPDLGELIKPIRPIRRTD